MKLREGHILRVPITQGGQDEVLTVVVDRVVEARCGAQCHLSSQHRAFWLPSSVVRWAIARAEAHLDGGAHASAAH